MSQQRLLISSSQPAMVTMPATAGALRMRSSTPVYRRAQAYSSFNTSSRPTYLRFSDSSFSCCIWRSLNATLNLPAIDGWPSEPSNRRFLLASVPLHVWCNADTSCLCVLPVIEAWDNRQLRSCMWKTLCKTVRKIVVSKRRWGTCFSGSKTVIWVLLRPIFTDVTNSCQQLYLSEYLHRYTPTCCRRPQNLLDFEAVDERKCSDKSLVFKLKPTV